MDRVTNKKLSQFIDKIAYVGNSEIPNDEGKIYYSRTDGSYLTRVGMEEDLIFLLKKGITEDIQNWGGGKTACLGFNPSEQKWYGWSHRAIFGFGIGSECKKGSCGFKSSNAEEFKETSLKFWMDDEFSMGDEKVETAKDYNHFDELVDGFLITYTYNEKVPNISMRGTKREIFVELPYEWGKGEWTATTLEEAKQMAIDFARSVS